MQTQNNTAWSVWINVNDNGVKVYYGHLSSVKVAKGDKVEMNTVIGTVGKTGTATGPNLHFEIQINGEYKDPEQIFSIHK